KAFDRQLLRRLWPFTKPYTSRFAIGLALLFVITALEIAGPWVLKVAIDGVAAMKEQGAPLVELTPTAMFRIAAVYVGACAAIYVAIGLSILLARYVQTMVLTQAGQRVLHDVRRKLFAHLQNIPIKTYDHTPTGRLVTRVTSDVETLNELFTSGIVTLVGDVVKIVAMLAVLFLVNVKLALLALATIPVLALASAYFRVRARQSYRATRTAIARVTSYLGETISGMRVLQAFSREDKAVRIFGERNAEHMRAHIRTIFFFALFFPVVDFIGLGTQAGTLWIGGIEIAGERLRFGEFIQFWYYLNFIFEPLRELAERYNVLQSAMASAERIFGLFDIPQDQDEGRTTLNPPRGGVRFEHVDFAYVDGRPVLEDISFEVKPGETLALVGATGGGKTTIAALLARFYEPTAGRVLVDGVDVKDLPRAHLRDLIAYVPQDVFLFTGTVMENLRLSDRVGAERAQAAARAIDADRFIQRFPGGYDHVLAERGQNLSAGERQLLAFVRALAKDPRILILDEATANVDPTTEATIQAAIPKLLEGRTSIVIAHRLSTVRRADRILVLHKGKLREQGTHEELLRANGLYAALVRLQFQES
ncbi:MAG: ABC transporter ATP-binding protein, partial [Planctomycetes bacterium]|nr:ABC transporter ATP-binding protein [Planctomycetota bacterium]